MAMQKQEKSISLQQEIAKARGLRKVELLNTLARELKNTDVRQALAFSTMACELALKLLRAQWKKQHNAAAGQVAVDAGHYPDYVHGIAQSYYMMGVCHVLLDDHANGTSFLSEALVRYRALREYESQVRTLEAMAYINSMSGQYQTALEYCMEGLELHEQVTDSGCMINMFIMAGDVCCSLAQYDKALSYAEQAGLQIERTKKYESKGMLLNVLGKLYWAMNRRKEALVCVQEYLEIQRHGNNKYSITIALLHLGNVLSDMGEYKEALTTFTEGLLLCEETGQVIDTILFLGNIANIYRILGSYETAFEYYTRGLHLAKTSSDIPGQASMLEGLGIVYSHWNEHEKALEAFLQAQALFEQTDQKRRMAYIKANIGMLYRNMGDLEQAWEQFNYSLLLSGEIQDSTGEILNFYNLADIRYQWQEYEQAAQLCHRGLALSEKTGSRPATVRGLYQLGRTCSAQGKFESALEYLIRALELATELQEKEWLLETYRELSELYEQTGNAAGALRAYREYHRLERESFNAQSDDRMRKLQVLHQVEQVRQEKKIYEITNEKLQQENESQRKELASKAMYLSQKNELLEKIRRELRSIAKSVPQEAVPPVKSLLRQIDTAMSDDQAWSIFEEQFQKVHEPFMRVLRERYPHLSMLEVRVCALIRLNLSTKEISRILNVTPRSVETYRYRIRKKLDADAAESLNEFLMRL